jgi:hypothetical protein
MLPIGGHWFSYDSSTLHPNVRKQLMPKKEKNGTISGLVRFAIA